jgi:hypothetical protein
VVFWIFYLKLLPILLASLLGDIQGVDLIYLLSGKGSSERGPPQRQGRVNKTTPAVAGRTIIKGIILRGQVKSLFEATVHQCQLLFNVLLEILHLKR